ncbi:DNA primase [Undibacterium sp. RTI2.1]|uniref:DNA primase n=1 Tax=unclassified Undibacterium TaxID=2630295 RepID=UPI002AB5BF15|nr:MULTISPECIES: DNA primase [unclassified Undibacterium]MDY7538961.1 DNA primase [Undibacterium sp. 5I1]MEB0031388.1 DNA primase [Undibacterium sp. RTI2.1]MEB0117636.1 DNA primase [Undibacterium sp. RTI2.2]MEB0232678.1 DNA primase [Undibacterium sp. 10I3]MEB0258622.1 DNA primase [Undibacterium sp. 5I1]
MIPQTFIQDLLARVDIVDVVGKYVQLKKGGANYMGLCPFHNEKSPSFTVSPTKQFYHCFGCGAHGTSIGFLMEYSGLSFVDAVKDLAQSNGMIVPEDDKLLPAQRAEVQAKSLALTDVMTKACDHYRTQLRSAEGAIAYLKKRGLTGEIAARFGLGYAPDGWDGLRAVFPDYAAPPLVEAGLVIDKSEEEGGGRKRYDRFRDRIMFPIRNTKGQVIGFGGRILEQGEPKYLNSPETPLFQKGFELYGLFEARQAIREAGYVLVTEGYMDVVALAQMGFPQAVATLGTACTPTHVQKLLRQTDHVIFSFDGDSAGRRAARRALDACLPHANDNKVIKFLFLPTEHDPDSYIRELGNDAFAQQVQDAMPLSQFFMKEVIGDSDLSTAEGRAKVQFDAKPLLQQMPPSGLRLQMVRSLAQVTKTTPSEIEALFELAQPVSRVKIAPPKSRRSAPVGLERQIMRILVAHPSLSLLLDAAALADAAQLAPDGAEMLTQLVLVAQTMGQQANFAALAEHLRTTGADYDALIAEIAEQTETDLDVVKQELAGAIRQMRFQVLKAEMEALAASGLRDAVDIARYREIMQLQEALRRQAVAEVAVR